MKFFSHFNRWDSLFTFQSHQIKRKEKSFSLFIIQRENPRKKEKLVFYSSMRIKRKRMNEQARKTFSSQKIILEAFFFSRLKDFSHLKIHFYHFFSLFFSFLRVTEGSTQSTT